MIIKFCRLYKDFSSVFNNTYLHDNSKPLVNTYSMYLFYLDITFNQVTFSEENTSIVSSNILNNQSDFKNSYKLIPQSNKNRGGFLNPFGSDVSIYSTIFINGRADYGGAIYVYDTNYYARNWTFFSNIANTESGTYYVILSRYFKIERHLFQENSANVGESISVGSINKYLKIINWNFTSSFPSQFIYADFASMTITHSDISNNAPSDQNIESFNLRYGEAIKISTTVRIDLVSSTFQNIINSNGAISLSLSNTEITLSDLFSYLYIDSDTQLVNIFATLLMEWKIMVKMVDLA